MTAPIPRTTDGSAVAALEAAWSDSGIALLTPADGVVDPEAAEHLLAHLAGLPDVDVVYSDPAVEGPGHLRLPDWSPERLRGHDYLHGLVALRRNAYEGAGGLNPGPHQWHDLWLRLSETGARVERVRKIGVTLPHQPVPADGRGQAAVVQAHLDRVGEDATAEPAAVAGYTRLRRRPRGGASVSLVVPTRGGSGPAFGSDRNYLVAFIADVERRTYTVEHEWVVVADVTDDMGYLDEVRALAPKRLRVVEYAKPFNFAEKCNLGALHAEGEVVVFLNDDMGVISDDWLDSLTAMADRDGVGTVGTVLRTDDGLLQHAGHIYGKNGPYHAYHGSASTEGHLGELVVDREVSGVTAACVAQRRSVWEEVGGFSEVFGNNFNDVDYCLKLRQRGYRNLLACSIELHHLESRTRDVSIDPAELDRLFNRWRHRMGVDPYTVGGP